MKAYVSPEPSERYATVIFRSGSETFGFSALICGSDQFVILPR